MGGGHHPTDKTASRAGAKPWQERRNATVHAGHPYGTGSGHAYGTGSGRRRQRPPSRPAPDQQEDDNNYRQDDANGDMQEDAYSYGDAENYDDYDDYDYYEDEGFGSYMSKGIKAGMDKIKSDFDKAYKGVKDMCKYLFLLFYSSTHRNISFIVHSRNERRSSSLNIILK